MNYTKFLTPSGKAFIHANGTRIATHYYSVGSIGWNHKNPNLKSFRSTTSTGQLMGSGTTEVDYDSIEVDADRKGVGFTDPGLGFPPPPSNDLFQSNQPSSSIRHR